MTTSGTTTYSFTFLINRPLSETEERNLALTLNERILGSGIGTLPAVNVYWDSPSALKALAAARKALTELAPGVYPTQVTLDLVTVPLIAERFHITSEAVRKWVKTPGKAFPQPFEVLGDSTSVWDWGSVAGWAKTHRPSDAAEDVSYPTRQDITLFNAELVKAMQKPNGDRVVAHATTKPAASVNVTSSSIAARTPGSRPRSRVLAFIHRERHPEHGGAKMLGINRSGRHGHPYKPRERLGPGRPRCAELTDHVGR